jgi:hypothetical protein
MQGIMAYLLSWESLLELSPNRFGTFDIAISRLSELASLFPFDRSVLEECQGQKGVRWSMR